jgi:hypothetical protein
MVQACAEGGITLNWLGENRWMADQLLSEARKAPDAVTKLERTLSLFREILKDGARETREIWELLHGKHIGKSTLYRAREKLGIRSAHVSYGGRQIHYWLLPGQKLPPHLADQDVDLEEYLAPIREMFPAPTPIDDL